MSANVVALVSVIVTGIASPVIAGVVTSARLRAQGRRRDAAQRAGLLDEAAAQLVRTQMAFVSCMFQWRTGRHAETPAAQEEIRRFHAERETAWVMYARLATRFGVGHPVVGAFAGVAEYLRSLRMIVWEFESSNGEPDQEAITEHLEEVSRTYRELERTFFDAAYEVVHADASNAAPAVTMA